MQSLKEEKEMMNTQSYSVDQHMERGEQLNLIRTYSRFLKLRKSGFPLPDARSMTGLQDDQQFEKAQEVYQSYL